MEKVQSFFLFLFHFSSLLLISEAQQYTLPENFFINCGSSSSPTLYSRTFTGDLNSSSLAIRFGQSRAVVETNISTNELYQSAMVFSRRSGYEFRNLETGTYVVRFHFFPFSSMGNLSLARFSVHASGFSLISNFSVTNTTRFTNSSITEFLLNITSSTFRVDFVPNGESSFAFINAIEVIRAPPYLLRDYHNGTFNPLQVIHRINVGGGDVPPNDLFRNWTADDAYLLNRELATNSVYVGNLQGLSEESYAPDSVYRTAKIMNINNSFNITWRFDVKREARHLVRVHFCDIVNNASNPSMFNLFIYNDYNQEINPFIFQLAVPFHYDTIATSDDSGFMNISVGPSNDSRYPSFLNGVEIMELITDLVSPGGSNSRQNNLLFIVGSSVAGLVLVLIILAVFVFHFKRRKWKNVEAFDRTLASVFGGSSESRTTADKTTSGAHLLELNLGLKVTFSEILYATKNFDNKLMIGKGGFGKVYKGILKNGTKVAVKRSESGHGQGFPEFQTEITVLSKVRHKHLVSLIGYCDEHDEMILVYEFMEKGTLRDHLYFCNEETGESASRSELSWDQRLKICIGAANGIQYLHTGSNGAIIHRDIKSTNILLDEHYVAKVADFGLSRSGILDQTHVSTEVKGSFGYLDPEYFRCLQLTQKSDVYSFGVVLLEVLCARSAIDHSLPREQINLAEWGLSFQMKGQLEKIIDPLLMGKINLDSLRKFGETVEKCLQDVGTERPNMVDVLWDLEYCMQLQQMAKPRQPYEDSTTNASWDLSMRVVERLPSDSIIIGENEGADELYSFSNAGEGDASEVFSQLKIDEAR